MSSFDAMSFGPAGGLRFSRNSGRSLTSEALGAIRYPSPFFDIAHTYLPASFKTMLRWCRYYFLTNPLINAVCYKMAEYPVTDLIFDTENQALKDKWNYLFNTILNFKKFEIEAGLDYNTYGNAFISISYPFQKLLICKNCKHTTRVEQQKYVFREYKFVGECAKCKNYGEFRVRDHYIRSVREIRLVRWNPEYITVQYNDATGESRYYYMMPPQMANDVRMAKRHVIERIPEVFIEALRQNKALLFSKDNIYHMKRPTIAQKDKGWGMPMVLPVLKDVFYLQVLRKAQEAIAVEHIVPMRILFPQTSSATADVYCVSQDTLIETREGLRPASEVREGDFVKTHTGLWKPVEGVKDRPTGASKVYQVTPASLSAFPFKVSEEHPLLAARRLGPGYDQVGEPEWVRAGDLKEKDFVLYPVSRTTWDKLELDLAEYIQDRASTEQYIYRRLSQHAAEAYEYFEANGVPEFGRGEREQFLSSHGWDLPDYSTARTAFLQQDKIDRISRFLGVNEDLAYVIGLYIAEGFPKGCCAALGLHSKESYLMDKMDEAIRRMGFRESTRGFNGNSGRYEINDVLLSQLLLVACGKGAQNKRLPRFILEAPANVMLSALRGLYDGDGCNIATATRRVNLMTVSPELAVEVRQLLLSLGLLAGVQKRIPKEDEIAKLPIYHVNVNGRQAEELASLLGWDPAPVTDRELQTRSQCGFFRGSYVYLRVREIQEVQDVDEVRGFQVAGDQSFCVVGVATHNSTVNLTQWRDKIEQELIRWRLDNNYIPILPIPVGQQTLGGDGRALMLAQEYRVWSEQVVAGMGVPVEFVYGGMQYCQILSTYVFTDKGMVQLKDLVSENVNKTTLGEGTIATGLAVRKIDGAHNTGMKRAAKLKTRLGLDATPSHDHHYRVLNSDMEMVWKRAKELQPGDKLAVQSGMNVWASKAFSITESATGANEWSRIHPDVANRYPSKVPSQVTKELARLLGYFVSEGTCTQETKISFSQVDEHVMEDFLNCSEKLFEYRPKRWEGDGTYLAEIGRRPPVLFLKSLGVVGYSHEKSVPECILRSPKDIVVNFLKAYFEGDGSISTTGSKQMVSCGSKSEELLKQIQLLLLNLGVVASRYYDESHEMWQLQIRSEYVDTFAAEIGFVSPRKQAEIANRTQVGKTHMGERIPYLKEALDKFRSDHFKNRSSWEFEKVALELKQEEYTVREVAELLDRDVTTVHYLIKHGRLVSHRRLPGKAGQFGPALVHQDDLRSFLENFGVGKRKSVPGRHNCGMTYSKLSSADLRTIEEKDPELAHRIGALVEARYVWDEVVDVELFDFEVPMGDLTVEVDHSYIADGLVTHNSGSNVSMRMLENHFLSQKAQRKQLVTDFLMPSVGAFMGWDVIPCHYKRFKMADDLQRSALFLQLNQAGKLSDKALLEDTDWDSYKEAEAIAVEQKRVLETQRSQALAQAAIQGEAQLVGIKYQTRAQKIMMAQQAPPMDPQQAQQMQQQGAALAGQPGSATPNAMGADGNAQTAMANRAGAVPPMDTSGMGQQQGAPAGQAPMEQMQSPLSAAPATQDPSVGYDHNAQMDVMAVAQQVVSWLNQLPDHEKQAELAQIQRSNPQLFSLVTQMLQTTAGANRNSAAMPQPEQRPARRGPEAAQL